MNSEFEHGGILMQEALERLKRLAVGDEELLVTLDGKDIDIGERVYDELVEVKNLAGEQEACELARQYREYLRGMEDVQDVYPSIAAALKGIQTFEDELAHRF